MIRDFRLRGAFAISIHAPPRGATPGGYTPGRPFIFQFTPLREGRHDALEQAKEAGYISIHAPPRGATCPASHNVGDGAISIHAPPRGATRNVKAAASTMADFNSRPSAWGDGAMLKSMGIADISIHAPPRGATGEAQTVIEAQAISIHAPPRGATATQSTTSRRSVFQFTPLREGRPCWKSAKRLPMHFNSRPSARGD